MTRIENLRKFGVDWSKLMRKPMNLPSPDLKEVIREL